MTGNATDEAPVPARIPVDIEREDRVLGPFTARQTAWLAAGGLALYVGFWLLRAWLSPLAYLALVTPVAGVLVGLSLGRREGIALDRFAGAALVHSRAPKRVVHAPEGVPALPGFLDEALVRQSSPAPVAAELPCRGVDSAGTAGLLDLGRDGRAAVAACSMVPFALRSGAEQQGLAAGFGRWLNSLTGPAQILVRGCPIDLSPAARHLDGQAGSLPHPALAAAARAHAAYLARLAESRELVGREALLVVREPGAHHAAGARAGQRIADAATALAAADIDARPLAPDGTAEALRAACNPEPPAARRDDEEEEEEGEEEW